MQVLLSEPLLIALCVDHPWRGWTLSPHPIFLGPQLRTGRVSSSREPDNAERAAVDLKDSDAAGGALAGR